MRNFLEEDEERESGKCAEVPHRREILHKLTRKR